MNIKSSAFELEPEHPRVTAEDKITPARRRSRRPVKRAPRASKERKRRKSEYTEFAEPTHKPRRYTTLVILSLLLVFTLAGVVGYHEHQRGDPRTPVRTTPHVWQMSEPERKTRALIKTRRAEKTQAMNAYYACQARYDRNPTEANHAAALSAWAKWDSALTQVAIYEALIAKYDRDRR